MYADALSEARGVPTPALPVGSLGTLRPPVEDCIGTVDEFVDYHGEPLPPCVDGATSVREILGANGERRGDAIDTSASGASRRAKSTGELVRCSQYCPPSNPGCR